MITVAIAVPVVPKKGDGGKTNEAQQIVHDAEHGIEQDLGHQRYDNARDHQGRQQQGCG